MIATLNEMLPNLSYYTFQMKLENESHTYPPRQGYNRECCYLMCNFLEYFILLALLIKDVAEIESVMLTLMVGHSE